MEWIAGCFWLWIRLVAFGAESGFLASGRNLCLNGFRSMARRLGNQGFLMRSELSIPVVVILISVPEAVRVIRVFNRFLATIRLECVFW